MKRRLWIYLVSTAVLEQELFVLEAVWVPPAGGEGEGDHLQIALHSAQLVTC